MCSQKGPGHYPTFHLDLDRHWQSFTFAERPCAWPWIERSFSADDDEEVIRTFLHFTKYFYFFQIKNILKL